jgi:superfamily II DNA or RNA helicase
MMGYYKNPPSFQSKTHVFLDASATGTGKTYAAMALCAVLKLKPIIVCPKSVLSAWTAIAELFGVSPTIIVNYEQLIAGNSVVYADDKWQDLKPGSMLIFDEAHRCKNSNHHGRLLLSLKGRRVKILLLSATIADTPDSFRNFGFLMNFYGHPSGIRRWVKCISGGAKDAGMAINRAIFPRFASRMRQEVIQTESVVKSHCFKMDNADKIAEQHHLIEASYDCLKSQRLNAGSAFARIMNARQTIELLKVPTFLALIRMYVQKGKSVVMFVNFNETLELLARELQIDCVIHGGQSLEERNAAIAAFQGNEQRIMLCNIKAGGVGISLHDLHGGHPRVSLISPTWSAQDFVQCLGRIHRVGARSNAAQKIIYCAGTIEKHMCDVLRLKLDNLSKVNDGDLDAYPVETNKIFYELR